LCGVSGEEKSGEITKRMKKGDKIVKKERGLEKETQSHKNNNT
jgi:hypothetical protein